MRAILVESFGGPDALCLVDLPTPAPGPGEVLVRVEAAGVNFIDVYQRTGLYPSPLPLRAGQEGAGVVLTVGDGDVPFRPGERVAWASVSGSYASHVVAPAAALVRVPEGIDGRLAAASMLQGMTAHYLTRSTFPLREGHTCLVHAAAGGVGLLLCQLAKRAGARVLGTVSSAEKAELAREHGCDEPILYTQVDFAKEARRLTGGVGVDVVYDSVGQTTFEGSLASLRPRGMMVSYGQSSGAVAPIPPLLLSQRGSLFLTRPKLGDYVESPEALRARARDILELVETGDLRVRIQSSLPLDRAGEAHRLLESRRTMGKLLLLP